MTSSAGTAGSRPELPTQEWWRRNAPSPSAGAASASEQSFERPSLNWYIRAATRVLAGANVASPGPDALELAGHVLGVERLIPALAPNPDREFAEAYRGVVQRRASREPLQHITGKAHFRYLTLDVGPGVFVPRPETEVVAQAAIDEAKRLVLDPGRSRAGIRPIVVDLCAGSGAMAIAIATEVPEADVIGLEFDDRAAVYAAANISRNVPQGNLKLVLDDVTSPFVLNDLIGIVDVVVSNPPYIPPGAVPIDPEVRDFDPSVALYGEGDDGLQIPRAVIQVAKKLLPDGGLFVMEHGDQQGRAVREMTEHRGAFIDVRTGKDLAGRDRFVIARRHMRKSDGLPPEIEDAKTDREV